VKLLHLSLIRAEEDEPSALEDDEHQEKSVDFFDLFQSRQ
jgi:hypothetical protein